MGSLNKIKLVVEAQDEASEPIEKVTEATKKLGRESKKTTDQSKKDWGGLGDLFSQVLPRNLQSLTRGFKGTQRQVGRLSKSFKMLKAAWASIGIGLIIIALEELIANWDKVTDAINGTTQAEKDFTKVQQAGTNATIEATSELDVYRNVLNDTTASEVARKDALVKLAQATGLLEGIDINNPEDAEKVNKAYLDYLDNVKKQASFDQSTLLIKEKKRLLDSGEAKFLTFKQKAALTLLAISGSELFEAEKLRYQLENQKAVQDDLLKIQEEQNKLQKESAKSQDEIAQAIIKQQEAAKKLADEENEARKEADRIEREAEAARKKALADAEANARWLANQRITIAQETELRLIQDEEKRELRSLEIQNEAAKEELALRGGTLEDKLALENKYLLDVADIENEYQDRRDEAQKIKDQKELEDAATVAEALATERENEIQRVKDRYALLQELAIENSEESKELTEKSRLEIEAINKKFDDQEVADAEKVQAIKLAAVNKMVNAVSGLLNNLSDLAEGNSEQQKRLAVVDILINQAVAMANAVAGAAKASKDTGPGAPFVFAAYVATMLGTIAGTFASIKGIMSEAGESGGGSIGSSGGGRGGFAPNTQVPLPARIDTPSSMQAYVVQSQLQGQINAQGRLDGQIIL